MWNPDIENSPYSLEFSVFNTGYVGRIKKNISKKGFEQFMYTFVGKKNLWEMWEVLMALEIPHPQAYHSKIILLLPLIMVSLVAENVRKVSLA